MVQVVKHLSSKCEALSSTPRTAKKKKKRRRRRRGGGGSKLDRNT
jgi:hypothetical protein